MNAQKHIVAQGYFIEIKRGQWVKTEDGQSHTYPGSGIAYNGSLSKEQYEGLDRVIRAYLDGTAPVPEERAINTMPLFKRLREQRDECADALRRLANAVEQNFPDTANQPGGSLEQARKALAKVPTYSQQLDNICAGIGITRAELEAALSPLGEKNHE